MEATMGLGVEDYLQMGHAEKIPLQEVNKSHTEIFYLPMHGVVKDTSSTTRLRIVFDGSAKSSSGYFLNDILLPGPSLYPFLSIILNRFCLHKIGMSGDISKMFWEVGLLKKDHNLRRFLHQDSAGNLIDCRMHRLSFGITTSPYLASQVLMQLASDHREEFPRAAELVHKTFYVDDCLTGADNIQETKSIHEELNQLLSKGKMTLCKWKSSSTELLERNSERQAFWTSPYHLQNKAKQ